MGELKMHLAEKLFFDLQYIKTRKKYGLEENELTKTIPIDEYIAIAEGFIELQTQKQKAQSND